MSGVTISQGGVLPNIISTLLPKKSMLVNSKNDSPPNIQASPKKRNMPVGGIKKLSKTPVPIAEHYPCRQQQRGFIEQIFVS